MENNPSQSKNIIRNVYLYLISAISLFMIVFSVVSLINLGLRVWMFPKADMYYSPPGLTEADSAKQKMYDEENRVRQRQNDMVQNISFLIVAIPLFAFHWTLIRRDRINSN